MVSLLLGHRSHVGNCNLRLPGVRGSTSGMLTRRVVNRKREWKWVLVWGVVEGRNILRRLPFLLPGCSFVHALSSLRGVRAFARVCLHASYKCVLLLMRGSKGHVSTSNFHFQRVSVRNEASDLGLYLSFGHYVTHQVIFCSTFGHCFHVFLCVPSSMFTVTFAEFRGCTINFCC